MLKSFLPGEWLERWSVTTSVCPGGGGGGVVVDSPETV